MRRPIVVLTALLLAATAWLTAATSLSRAAGSGVRSQSTALRYLHQRLVSFQHATWHWQRVMGTRPAPTHGRVLTELSVRDAQQAVALWRQRSLVVLRRAQHPPHLRAWLCIHHYEAGWFDHGAPYYGGLQMDWTFMHHYGGWLLREKGTADHWTPLEQIWVAERARSSGRGFWPWPNTARVCGLI